jgi:hypothetical protein
VVVVLEDVDVLSVVAQLDRITARDATPIDFNTIVFTLLLLILGVFLISL